jgi:hypothetical protein
MYHKGMFLTTQYHALVTIPTRRQVHKILLEANQIAFTFPVRIQVPELKGKEPNQPARLTDRGEDRILQHRLTEGRPFCMWTWEVDHKIPERVFRMSFTVLHSTRECVTLGARFDEHSTSKHTTLF